MAFDLGGWLAPALLLYAAQRLARSGASLPKSRCSGAPDREVRGTLSLNAVVVAGPDNLPRSIPLELELRAGDSLAILCDAPDDAAILADVLAGRRAPRFGERDGRRTLHCGSATGWWPLVAPGEPFVPGGLNGNLAVLTDRPLDRAAVAAVRDACSLTEVAEALGDRPLAIDGEPLTAYHKMLVLVARVIPSPFRLLVVVDPMPWVNAVRGELWRTAVVRASVGRTSIWITPDRDLAGRATWSWSTGREPFAGRNARRIRNSEFGICITPPRMSSSTKRRDSELAGDSVREFRIPNSEFCARVTLLRRVQEESMGTFQGGSAPAMAKQICDGYSLVTQVSLKRLSIDQMVKLEFELDKRLRETRGDVVSLDDQAALQARNRRISRIEGSLRVLRHTMQQRRIGRL